MRLAVIIGLLPTPATVARNCDDTSRGKRTEFKQMLEKALLTGPRVREDHIEIV